jgi:nucleotide-binding universal stress UspA family protein
MIRHVLCPIDFSDFSRHALDHAVAIAHLYEARVTVLHVSSPAHENMLLSTAGVPPLPTSRDRSHLIARTTQFVEQEIGAVASVEIAVSDAEDVSKDILAHAGALHADLLVMGTHGRSGFDRLVLGSVTEKVLRKAPCPVLTVPRRAPDVVPAGQVLYKRILCGVDFSDASMAALSYALSLAQQADAWLGVVHVVELLPGVYDAPLPHALIDVAREIEADARQRFSVAVPATAREACQVEDLVVVGHVRRTLVSLAEERHAELIVLGVQGRGAIDRMVFGSTADYVVRRASCPVLTIRELEEPRP